MRLLALVALLGPSAHAQITVTRADVEALLGTARTVTSFSSDTTAPVRAALDAVLARTGADQTWDLTGLAFTTGLTIRQTPVAPPQPGSDDPHFAQATVIVRSESVDGAFPAGVGYYRLEADRLVSLGSAGPGPMLQYRPGIVQPLPYTFGSAWAAETDVVFDPPAFPGTQRLRDESRVVGWGTLVTPAGAAPALMVETRLLSRMRVEAPGAPPAETVDTTRSVTFLTGGPLTASVTLTADGHAHRASYTVPTAPTTQAPPPHAIGARLTVGPNPAPRGATAEVRFGLDHATSLSLAVFDVLGRRVATLAEGSHAAGDRRATWSTEGLAPGLYVVRLLAGDAAVVRRVSVAG